MLKKGLKYCFITSINQPITTEQQEFINKRNKELKLSFVQQIFKNLEQGGFQEKNLINNLEQLKTKIKQSGSNTEHLLNWVENLLMTYWLQLKEQVPNQMTTISERMDKMIGKLSSLFLSDYLYNDDCQWIKRGLLS